MKTTNKDYQIFKEECKKWIDFFGLTSWKILYEHENYRDSLASCTYYSIDKFAVLRLSKNWDNDEITSEEIKRCAFHEVCEMLLAHVHDFCFQKHTTQNEVTKEIHSIIRILENTVWKNLTEE